MWRYATLIFSLTVIFIVFGSAYIVKVHYFDRNKNRFAERSLKLVNRYYDLIENGKYRQVCDSIVDYEFKKYFSCASLARSSRNVIDWFGKHQYIQEYEFGKGCSLDSKYCEVLLHVGREYELTHERFIIKQFGDNYQGRIYQISVDYIDITKYKKAFR